MKTMYRLPIRLYGLMLLMGAMALAFATTATGRTPLADPLVLIQPTYDCATGAITFNTTGGDGSTITYNAPGIMRSSLTSNTGTVEQGLRNDPKPITVQATQSGQSTSYTFDLKAACSNTTSELPSPILAAVDDVVLRLDQLLTYPAIEISSRLYNPAISDDYKAWEISAQGLPPDMRISTSVLMKTFLLVSITGYARPVGIYPITVKAVNTRAPQNPPFVTKFTITVVDSSVGTGLALIAPTYNCATGAITFNTTGGNGSPITYSAPGITGPTTNPNQFVDAGLRQAADAQPLTLSATQNGATVTYRFDLRATCPIGTNPPVQPNQDRAILVELYNSTNGPGWTNKTNWLQGDSPCNWFGVTCDGNGRVTKLGLASNNLNGMLPASLGNLSKLEEIGMGNNKLNGSLPASLGNLSQLTHLSMTSNQLSGSIPTTLGNLSQLRRLLLNSNQLGGFIPNSLGNLGQLTDLSLFENKLTGPIPASLSTLANVEYIILDDNQLSGTIPTSLSNLSKLRYLSLINNQLTGSVPAFLGSLLQLQNLFLDNNQLSGCFPAELASLCGKGVRMTGNPGLPGGGDFASFCSNGTGACPTTPTTGNFTLIAPTYNCTTGAITFNTTGGDGSTITYFAPGITGPTTNPNQFVDAGLRQAADAQPITLSATQSGVTVTYRFDLRATCPIGTNPPIQTNNDRAILVEFYNSTNGPGWTNKNSWLQGDSPCGWYGVSCDGVGQVKTISLPDNKLAGTLPANLGNLSLLQVLNLTNNQLSGSIPVTLGNLARVDYLDLSRNQLSGSIPASLGNLLNTSTLYLYDNQLSGSIPASLGNLSNIQFLLLYNNQLSGSIPASFGSLTNIKDLRIDKNQLSGCFPAELSTLCGKGAYVDMSSNPNLPGGGDFASFCSNRTGACTTTPTTGALALIAPIYDCGTGGITFKTTGGDGSTITYNAPGITRSSLTSNTGTVEQGLRNDPKPITIQATQSGKTTSYLFDFGAFCKKDDIRLFGVDTTFFVSTYFDYKVGEVTTDQSNPIERWSKTVTNLPPGIYYNFRLLDDLKTYGLYIFGSKDNRIGSFPITITVINPLYPNLPVSSNLTLTFKSRNPTTGLTLIEPTYNCATGAFRFNTVGGNGTTIEYIASGITDWTTNPNQFVDHDSRTANDVKPFFLVARQGGTVVNYIWDLKHACGRARVAAEEAGTTLSLQLLGNPVHKTVQVLIKGAEGKPVQLRLTDERGHLLESRAIEQAGTEEMQTFQLAPAAGPGMLFLQATQQQQVRTVKILRQ